MSPRPVESLLTRLRHEKSEDGFGLVEVIVSMAIFAVVATAVLPVFMSSIQGAVSAKMQTQAKSLAQLRLERMHNMPYYVAQQNGPFRDLLDVYFRDAPSAGSATTGPLDALDDCKGGRRYEPARLTYVCDLGTLSDLGGHFQQVVETRFMNHLDQVVTPRVGYDSQDPQMDTPASNLLAIAVTTSWQQGGTTKSYTLRGRIASTSDQVALINSEVRATALRVSSTLAGGDLLQFEAGLFNADGATSIATTASTTALGAHASLQSGLKKSGASLTLTAPPDTVVGTPPWMPGDSLDVLGCERVCWSETTVSGTASATVSGGLPMISAAGSPLEARLARTTDAGDRGFTYSNSALAEVDPGLGITQLPLVSGAATGSGSAARTGGYLSATDVAAHEVNGYGYASLSEIQLFRTELAPAGVVKIKLDSSSLACRDDATTGTVTSAWSGSVSVANGTGGYTSYPVGPGAAQLPKPESLFVGSQPLSTWVAQWSALVDTSGIEQRPGVGSIPAVVSLLTAPVRGTTDLTSGINIAVGALACAAEDFR